MESVRVARLMTLRSAEEKSSQSAPQAENPEGSELGRGDDSLSRSMSHLPPISPLRSSIAEELEQSFSVASFHSERQPLAGSVALTLASESSGQGEQLVSLG